MLDLLKRLFGIKDKAEQEATKEYDKALEKADKLIMRLTALEDVLVIRKAKHV